MTKPAIDPEGVGAKFTLQGMLAARDKTHEGVRRIAEGIEVGMTARDALDLADRELEDMGMDRHWHAPLIRFGEETLKTFRMPVATSSVLQADDIYSIDLGVVWDGLEGDAGDTFVAGNDPEKVACATAVKEIWREVADHWRETRTTGSDLHAYAGEVAREKGWNFNHDILGHRVSDFPHAIYKAGWLSEFEKAPSAGLWILEIQISHPELPYGAFYEDLLVDKHVATSA